MSRAQVSAEILLWSSSLVCTAAFIGIHVEAASARRLAAGIGAGAAQTGAVLPLPLSGPKVARSTTGDVLGRLEIPALRLSTPIIDDDDPQSLLRGAGHIRGTAMPGGLGNFVVAAHRDTYFRPLSGIKAGMAIKVVTAGATYTYLVDSFKVVQPEDVDVLDMGNVPQLTLITCYPFHYIGAAPQRFSVSAHLASF